MSHYLQPHMLFLVTQSCLTLCDPKDCSPSRLLCPWGFSRQEYWSELPWPPPGDLPNPGIERASPVTPVSPALVGGFLTASATYGARTSTLVSFSLLLLFSWKVMSDSLQPMDCSTPGFPVRHQLAELAQTRVHRVGDVDLQSNYLGK